MRVTWPKYVNLPVCRTWTISLWISSSFNMAKFRLRSLLVTPQIFLNTDISKTLNFLFCSSWVSKFMNYKVLLSGAAFDTIILLWTCWCCSPSIFCEDSLQRLLLSRFFWLHPCHKISLQRWPLQDTRTVHIASDHHSPAAKQTIADGESSVIALLSNNACTSV